MITRGPSCTWQLNNHGNKLGGDVLFGKSVKLMVRCLCIRFIKKIPPPAKKSVFVRRKQETQSRL